MEGIPLGDVLQFGAMGVLTLVIWLVFGSMQKQLDAKDAQITKLVDALIETKLNAKALDIVTAQLAAVMPMAAAGFNSAQVTGASAFGVAELKRSENP